MKIVIATNPFKSSISSVLAGEIISKAFTEALPRVSTDAVPIADGGDGTLDCIATAVPAQRIKKKVPGPLGRPMTADYLLIDGGKTAVVEMARASGLALLKDGERNPMVATALGTGLLIRDAVNRGVKKIIVGIGGSATTEGGISAAVAAGYRFLNSKGEELPPVGASLEKIRRIDASGFISEFSGVDITVACDVTNPLYGPEGAAIVYSPQKGATPAMVRQLEKGLIRLADTAARDLGKDLRNVPGAGAAGGMGFGLLAFLGARLVSGIDMMISVTKLDQRLKGASLLITGEGRLDAQSAQGKAPYGLLKLAKKNKIPIIAFCGSVQQEKELYKAGFTAVFPIVTGPMTLEQAMNDAENLLYLAALRAARFYGAAMKGRP